MRVSYADFKNAVGRYFDLCEKEDVIITKNGKSVAKLVAHPEPLHSTVNEAQEGYKMNQRISYEKYLSYAASSEQRYELIDGIVYLLASPSFRHQVLVREVTFILQHSLSDKGCQVISAPFDVRLHGYASKFEEDPNVVQPDVVVICDLENITEDGQYTGIPTLVVEVLSPSTRDRDLVTKLNLYMRSGVNEYWVIDPIETLVWQYSFTNERTLQRALVHSKDGQLVSSCFPGFTLNLNELSLLNPLGK